MKKIIILFLYFSAFGIYRVCAQEVAVKTNLLYDATTTMNLGIEIGLSHHTTIELSGNYNPWSFADNKKMKHWLVQPEFRYWTCEKFRRHFFGLHAIGGEFNAGGINLPFGNGSLRDHRYIGYLYGTGLSYGYHLMLGGRWGLEFTVGAGYARIHYREYALQNCTPRLNMTDKNYFGITKAGLTLVFMIK